MTVIVTIVTVTHMPPTCVGHHQNLLPLPHSPLFVFTVVVQIIGQWSAVTTLEITERKVMHPAQHQTGTTEKKQQKSALASSKNSQKSNGKSRNNDKPRTSGENPQRPETGRHHQQPQHSTQGKHNHNSFPYRDYRYHEQPRTDKVQ